MFPIGFPVGPPIAVTKGYSSGLSKPAPRRGETENSLTRVLSPPRKASPVRTKLRSVRARACVAAPSGGHTLADSVRRSVWVQAILSEHDESYAERQDQAGNHWIKRSGFNTNQIHDFQVRRACMPLSRLPARSGLDLSQDSCRSECT